ncbi:MAG: site-specific integrase, partial [Shinella sp.]
MNELLIIADPTLMAERQGWLAALADERRLSGNTLDAYERDTRQFLAFLTGHLAAPARLKDID